MTRYPKSGKGSQWTHKELQAISTDCKGDTLSDGRGLSGEVRVASDGKVSVRFKYAFKWHGKVSWHYCGTWPTTSMAEVRQNRDRASQQIKEGINPIDGREAERIQAQNSIRGVIEEAARIRDEALAVVDLFNTWLTDGVARKNDNAGIKQIFKNDVLPAFGAVKVSDVTEQHISRMLRKVVDRGCNRLAAMILTDLRQMFLWAEQRKPWRRLLIEGNPAVLVNIETIVDPDYDLSNERDRVLCAEEIHELAGVFTRMQREYEAAADRRKASRPVKKQTQLAIWIMLSTACRVGELLMAEWSHINIDERVWFIPKENVKGLRKKKRAQVIFLSDFTMRQFEELKKQSRDTKWCFPATKHGGHVALDVVTDQVGDRQLMFKNRKPLAGRKNDNSLVLNGGASGDWTPHDLRRTAATSMQALKVSLDVIDRCQNHVIKGSRVRRHYMHHAYAEEMRDAWKLLGEYLDKIISNESAEGPLVRERRRELTEALSRSP